MTDQLSLLPMLDDAEHPTWLLNGKPAIKADKVYSCDRLVEGCQITR